MAGAAVLVVVVLVLAAASAPAQPPAGSGYLVGAARIDTTPPPSAGAADFRSCPAAVFSGPRPFAFDEPYTDLNRSGRYELGEPYCDANGNARYDGIYNSGAVDALAPGVHDPLDARAVAISGRGGQTVVVVSVVAQGIFQNYIEQMRARARALRPGISDVIVSANHNESSPDTVGIYGGPAVAGTFGLRSGIDDYYMSYLVERVAQAAAQAYDARRPATLYARQFPLPAGLTVRLSKNFPTTDDQGRAAAIDPKVGVLQARGSDGRPIATVMSLAAHNQEIGHSSGTGHMLSSDWPGYFHRALESRIGGMAMYLVGDNGSEEDPETVPAVSTAQHPECKDGCYAQAQATGEAFASAVATQAPRALRLSSGAVTLRRRDFFVPIENNLFKGAAAAGLFGTRPTYLAGVDAGKLGPDLRTEVGVLDVGPDLQMLANPGEAFPALMLGSRWGLEDAGCPSRPNPPVPTWHARSRYRFQVGLADDFIGYEIPAWAYSDIPGTFTTTCVNDADDRDAKGHQHKLETEGVGPTASNAVATQLTALLGPEPDPTGAVRLGRFVLPDGSLSRNPAGAVGVWVADPGVRELVPGRGTVVALARVAGFGARRVDQVGRFMDYDGAGQPGGPDITSRGMIVYGHTTRYYLDVYPPLPGARLGPARTARLKLVATPSTLRAGVRRSVRFGVAVATARGPAAVMGALVRAGGRRARTNAAGGATLTLSLAPGSHSALATLFGALPGRTILRALGAPAARSRRGGHRRQRGRPRPVLPRFTG